MKTDEIAAAITEQCMHLLPRNMQSLAAVVGLSKLVILIKHHGGGAPLYIPKEATPDHQLWELIGEDAFRALVVKYPGDSIEIAKCEKAARDLVHKEIRFKHFKLGETQDNLARGYGFTVRHIRNIAYYTNGQDEDDRQGGLF